MSVIAPPSVREGKTDKKDKMYFSKCCATELRRMIRLDDGRQMSVAQAGAERLANIMLYAESNIDAINAAKVLFDRVEGKPAVIKTEDAKPMPKMVIKLNNVQYERGRSLAEESEYEDYTEDEEPKLHIEMDNGQEYEG